MTQPYQDSIPQDPLDPSFTDDLLHALAAALPSPEQETDVHKRRRQAAAMAVLRSFDAQEPAEAMLASHVVLAHQFTLECYRRAAHATTEHGYRPLLTDGRTAAPHRGPPEFGSRDPG